LHSTFQDSSNIASVTPTSQVCVFAILWIVIKYGGIQWHNVHT